MKPRAKPNSKLRFATREQLDLQDVSECNLQDDDLIEDQDIKPKTFAPKIIQNRNTGSSNGSK